MSAPRRAAARVVRNTGLGGLHQLISVAVGFLLLPWMLVHMGDQLYGVLLIVQILSLNGMIGYAELGLNGAVVRELAFRSGRGEDEEARRVLATGIWAFVVIGAVMGLLVAAAGELVFFRVFRVPAEHAAQVRVGYLLYAATFWLHFPLRILKGFLMALQDFVLLKLWETVERVATGVALAVTVVLRPTIVAAIAAELAAVTLVALVFVAWSATRHPGRFSAAPSAASFSRLRGMAPLGTHIYLTNLTIHLYVEGPKLFAATFLGPAAVTYLAIVTRIPRALKQLASSANSALFPAVATLDARGDRATVRRLLERGTRYGYALLTPVVAFVLVYAEEILRVWVGPEYVFLAWLMRGFVAWQFAATLGNFLRAGFTSTDEFAAVLRPSLIGNVVFLAIVLALVVRAGLWAVLAGLTVGTLITIAASLGVHRRANGLDVASFLGGSVAAPALTGLAACAIFAAVRFALPAPGLALLLVIFLVGAALYGLLFYRTVMGADERTVLSDVLRSVRVGA